MTEHVMQQDDQGEWMCAQCDNPETEWCSASDVDEMDGDPPEDA